MALKAQGCTLKRGDGAGSETFISVGEMVSWSGFDGQATDIDVTHLESTAKEYKIGLEDNGQFTFRILFDPTATQHAGLRADRDAQTERNFQFNYVDDDGVSLGTDSFSGFVKQVTPTGEVDGRIEANVVIRVNGDVTFA